MLRDIGSQSEGPPPRNTPVKFFGATPITVYGVRLSVTVLPTIAGSDPRLRSQKPSLMTATGVACASSSARKPRPSAGSAPTTEKKFAVTIWIGICSDSWPWL